MPNFIRSENEADFYRTSGAGVFTLGGGDGTVLQRIIWEASSLGSGISASILDTQSGTATSGLWLEISGVRLIWVQGSGMFRSGVDYVNPIQLEYNVVMQSGLAIVISGGAVNALRASVFYISGQA